MMRCLQFTTSNRWSQSERKVFATSPQFSKPKQKCSSPRLLFTKLDESTAPNLHRRQEKEQQQLPILLSWDYWRPGWTGSNVCHIKRRSSSDAVLLPAMARSERGRSALHAVAACTAVAVLRVRQLLWAVSKVCGGGDMQALPTSGVCRGTGMKCRTDINHAA